MSRIGYLLPCPGRAPCLEAGFLVLLVICFEFGPFLGKLLLPGTLFLLGGQFSQTAFMRLLELGNEKPLFGSQLGVVHKLVTVFLLQTFQQRIDFLWRRLARIRGHGTPCEAVAGHDEPVKFVLRMKLGVGERVGPQHELFRHTRLLCQNLVTDWIGMHQTCVEFFRAHFVPHTSWPLEVR